MEIIEKIFNYVRIWVRFQFYKYRLRRARKHIYGLIFNMLYIYRFTGDFKTRKDLEVLKIFINNMENQLVTFYNLYIPVGITKERFRNKKEVVEFLNLAFEIKRKAFSKGIWGKK